MRCSASLLQRPRLRLLPAGHEAALSREASQSTDPAQAGKPQWRDEHARTRSSKLQLRWPKQGPQLSPAQAPQYERTTQPSSTATTDGLGARKGEIPESFLRQSVPIKVRVTVGKLKHNQELQRTQEEAGEESRKAGEGPEDPQGTDSPHQPCMQCAHTVYKRNLVLSAPTLVRTSPHTTRWPEP